MEIVLHEHEGMLIAEIISSEVVITAAQDILTLAYKKSMQGVRHIIFQREHLHPDFFTLRTGLAGDILQKCVMYHVHVAIVGDFSTITSQSFQDLIIESNRGRDIFFVPDVDTAKKMLSAIQT
jgi:hypothetical protein